MGDPFDVVYSAFNMKDIAERAGVAATSLYRRWGDVRVLIMEVAVERLTEQYPLPDTGALEQDLRAWARFMARGLNSQEGSSFFQAFIATALPLGSSAAARAAALKPRVVQLEAMLDRAKARGEPSPSVDDVVDMLLAPLYTRTLFGMPTDETLADRLVKRLLSECS
ncbi:TetR/AcrR family transcriptional regulator [Ralstonia sp. 11b]|uniref:TetR/AcrR family transcriptional regulator n=1 Tax=Ralstonia sp. 11b TaxID=3063544 RepID=UPI0028705D1B|nr:TetR/AcrR family transcriptional regulator [Ralstonia sp. 11b]MDR9385687.1 TetR/AcrR family transcriptional regulator [Ralstonia sp. 11b]MEA3270920.1 TetR/AcrR family transcriptional regulator [Pseudomonadota bacterium]